MQETILSVSGLYNLIRLKGLLAYFPPMSFRNIHYILNKWLVFPQTYQHCQAEYYLIPNILYDICAFISHKLAKLNRHIFYIRSTSISSGCFSSYHSTLDTGTHPRISITWTQLLRYSLFLARRNVTSTLL